MAGLSTTLPQNLRALMEEGRVEQALAELSHCEIGAREGRGATALHITPCPDELVRRLVERGEDINAADDHGRRPLHERACWAHKDQIGLLLELGAEVDAPDEHGRTPLHIAAEGLCPPAVDAFLTAGADPSRRATRWYKKYNAITFALRGGANHQLPSMLEIVERFLAAGARPTGAEATFLTPMSKDYQRLLAQRRRDGKDTRELEERGAALERLCRICGVEPAAPIRLHNGAAPIEVPDGPWQRAFNTLWDSLVPLAGRADTAQGEAIRIAGRIDDELNRNGGVNWDRAYRDLTDGLGRILASGAPLPAADLAEAHEHLAVLRTGALDYSAADRICELAVDWVRLNPRPTPNPIPDVGR